MRFESCVEIGASPERIWTELRDPDAWPQWVPSIKKVKIASPGSLGVGSELYVTVRAVFSVTLRMTVTEFAPTQAVVMKGKVFGTALTRSYRLESVGWKTRLVAQGDASGLLQWVMCRSGQRISDEILTALKKRVESVVLSGGVKSPGDEDHG